VLPGVLVAEVELTVLPLLDDVRDVKCGGLRTFLAFHGQLRRSDPDPR
jgi:hypothetical protein